MTRQPTILLALLVACGDTSATAPTQVNLDRPIDAAFGCYGGLRITNGAPADPSQSVIVSAQPVEACDIRSAPVAMGDPQPVPMGQEDLTAQGGIVIPIVGWYAFILQSATGTVALARWATIAPGGDDSLKVIDADEFTPGVNAIAVGEDPIAIQTDKIGCYEVTANAGSCDLSILDINSALDTDPAIRVDRLEVKNAAGTPVRARAAAMVAEPPTGAIGAMCPAQATGLMYIAYPNCHAVAAVDVSTGTIVSSIRYDATGTATIGDGNLTCPEECGAGSTTMPGVRPIALDLQLDPRSMRRALLIGADNSSKMTIVELGTDSKPLSLMPIPVEDLKGTLGFTSVALSPQIGMGGSTGTINDTTATGGQFQFAYGVATDGTVRVADILNLHNGAYAECDTQVDPRLIHDVRNVRTLSCFPVGDPTTPARRPGAHSPGVEFPGSTVPTSVSVYRAEQPTTAGSSQPTVDPTTLVGYFGLISSTNGAVFVLNIDDDNFVDFIDLNNPVAAPLPLDIANQLRDSLKDRGTLATQQVNGTDVFVCGDNGPNPDSQQGPNSGGPRLTQDPARNIPIGFFALEKAGALPSIRQVLCTDNSKSPPASTPTSELAFDAPLAVRDLAYPDLKALRVDETWTLTYEGALSNDRADSAVDGPSIRTGQIFVDGQGMHLHDATKPFCSAGVERFDIVQLRGCDPTIGDLDCPIGYRCFVHPNSQVAGLGACMLADEADRLADACKEYLISLRRYTVTHAATGELKLLPRKHVLATTPLNGCIDDNQCKALADYAARLPFSANPLDDKTPPDPHTYTCAIDPDRAPVPGTGKRCIETCTQDADCVIGAVCQNNVCMEGILPPQSCVNAPQRFDLRASEAFALLGSKSGYVHPTIADASSNCIKDPKASPLVIGRVPLLAPPCDPTADPRTGALPAGGFEPNPCSLTTDEVELTPVFAAPGSCTLANPPTVLTMPPRQAPGIKIRTRGITMTVVDPVYPGDTVCNGDRLGTLQQVPVVFPGYQIAFRQTAGFSSLTLPVQPTFPIKVVHGPLQSAWVMDEGDFLSTSVTQSSTRGAVFRVYLSPFGAFTFLD